MKGYFKCNNSLRLLISLFNMSSFTNNKTLHKCREVVHVLPNYHRSGNGVSGNCEIQEDHASNYTDHESMELIS